MFLTTQSFKKLIKDAYKSGLRIGNDGEGVFLCGSYWAIWIEQGRIPKKALGAVIELTGEMPMKGEAFKASPSGNQYEIEESVVYHVRENALSCKTELDVTNLIIKEGEGLTRILQEPENLKLHFVNNIILDGISAKELNWEEGEETPMGPFIGAHEGLFWVNNVMALNVMERKCKEIEIFDSLRKVRIMEEKR